jgi:hypothetical protein
VCTVSWVQQPGGYHLLANRDEKRTRGRAFAPAIREYGGVRYVAPSIPILAAPGSPQMSLEFRSVY